MKCFLKFALALLLCALCAVTCFAGQVPVRGSSNNGVDVNAPFWNLVGPTAPQIHVGGNSTLETQIVCTNQQVAAAVDNTDSANAGTCKDGAYTFLFQIQTANPSLTVVLSNLVGFTPSTLLPTYGLATCDNDPDNPNASNTLQLCTQVAGLDITGIDATVLGKKTMRISFTVPSVPAFPAGINKQGQGLTFVVLTQQTPGTAMVVPKIAIK